MFTYRKYFAKAGLVTLCVCVKEIGAKTETETDRERAGVGSEGSDCK